MEKRNSQCEHGRPMQQTRSLFCMCDSCVTTSVSVLANEFHVQSELHAQVSLAAVNQILSEMRTVSHSQSGKYVG